MLTKEKINYKLIDLKKIQNEIIQFTSVYIKSILGKVDHIELESLEEIRLRANQPIMIQNAGGDWFVDIDGGISKRNNNSYFLKQDELSRTLELMCENSIYAYQEEIKNGFITLHGGHRVGIAGRVISDGNGIKNIKDISGLNIRISKEVLGCADEALKHIISGPLSVYNTLIVSPPQCGKTTMLRDIARQLSSGIEEYGFRGIKVGVVDERSEIGACYKGITQNRLGPRTDILDGCPKVLGMTMMLRSMSPHVIITDEIGNQGDKEAIMKVVNAGVKIITTAHGYNISELKARQEILSLLEEKVIERFIVLGNSKGPGTIEEIIDGTNQKIICRK